MGMGVGIRSVDCKTPRKMDETISGMLPSVDAVATRTVQAMETASVMHGTIFLSVLLLVFHCRFVSQFYSMTNLMVVPMLMSMFAMKIKKILSQFNYADSVTSQFSNY